MADNEKTVGQAEDFVRRVLTKCFHQEVDQETVRAVAEKVSKSVEAAKPDG